MCHIVNNQLYKRRQWPQESNVWSATNLYFEFMTYRVILAFEINNEKWCKIVVWHVIFPQMSRIWMHARQIKFATKNNARINFHAFYYSIWILDSNFCLNQNNQRFSPMHKCPSVIIVTTSKFASAKWHNQNSKNEFWAPN